MSYWQWATTLAAYVITLGLIPMILARKRNARSAIAWSVTVIFAPFLGSAIYLLFGHNYVERRLRQKQSHRSEFSRRARGSDTAHGVAVSKRFQVEAGHSWENMGDLAMKMEATPISNGNDVAFYFDGGDFYDAMLEAIAEANHHIHMEFFIIQPDRVWKRFREALIAKARAGVEVRVLYDAIGSRNLWRRHVAPLIEAGGACSSFMRFNPLRRRIQVNLRNHRKVLVVDGRTGFLGGFNIGVEYLGAGPLGPWRDAAMRITGPAAQGLQQVFVEDWDFSTGDYLSDEAYFPEPDLRSGHRLQIAWSGPDQEHNTLREVFFAAVTNCRKRLWITTPYFVPDDGLLDGIRSAVLTGADVRILTQYRPDKPIALWASRYYWSDLMDVGVRIYSYRRGMIHAKTIIADDEFATLGTANFDNRSMYLNFEVNALIYSRPLVDELARAFERDLDDAQLIEPHAFARRPRLHRLRENVARLFSPLL